jgi:hypothetical protein
MVLPECHSHILKLKPGLTLENFPGETFSSADHTSHIKTGFSGTKHITLRNASDWNVTIF